MTIGGWITLILVIVLVAICAAGLVSMCDTTAARALWIIVGVILCFVTLFGMLAYYNLTESGKRAKKTEKSNLTGGISRTVTVYDYNGNQISSWTGTFDVTANEHETYFDIDGKRVVIHGGIVINEER